MNEALSGSLSVGYVRVYEGALTESQVAAAFESTRGQFGRDGGGDTTVPIIAGVGRAANGNVELSIDTIAGRNHTVQFSLDLATWNDIESFMGDGTPLVYTDDDAGRVGGEEGYYRIVIE